jgi:hypothetical protein
MLLLTTNQEVLVQIKPQALTLKNLPRMQRRAPRTPATSPGGKVSIQSPHDRIEEVTARRNCWKYIPARAARARLSRRPPPVLSRFGSSARRSLGLGNGNGGSSSLRIYRQSSEATKAPSTSAAAARHKQTEEKGARWRGFHGGAKS